MCDPLPLSRDGPWNLGESMKMGMTTLCDVRPYVVMIKFIGHLEIHMVMFCH
jgi:hypothetical protein